MAIATAAGHVSRAIDFYNKVGKYFSVGRTTPWEDETTPPSPSTNDYSIDELVALKKVDNTYLVVPDDTYGTINYRDTKWRIVQQEIRTTLGAGGVSEGSFSVPLTSLASIVVGIKLRINGVYEGRVTAVNAGTSTITLDTAAPSFIPAGSVVLGGAYVEHAKYVYISCTLSYDSFPIVTYRQIGLHTEVMPNTPDILRSAGYPSGSSINEYNSLGNLEIIDNRSPTTRTADQAENISLIIEF